MMRRRDILLGIIFTRSEIPNSPAMGERSYAPIVYTVRFELRDGTLGDERMYARDLTTPAT